MKRITLAILLAVVLGRADADTLYLRKGEQAQGHLVKVTAADVVFETRDGTKTWNVQDVIRIQLQQPRLHDDVQAAGDIADPDLKAAVAGQPTEKDYPADGAVTLLARKTFDLSTPGIIKEVDRCIVKVLQQRGEGNGTRSIWYYEDCDTPAVDFALTVTPDDRVLHLDDAALKSESIYARFPAYRRLARLRFACKEPRPGSILDIQTSVERRRDKPLEPFYTEELFRDANPILRKEVIVLIPAAREHEVAFGCSRSEDVTFAREEKDGAVRLAWTLAKPQPGIVQEPLMPPIHNFAPVVTLSERKTWTDIARAYAEQLANLDEADADMKKTAADLMQQGGVKALYNHVARRVQTAPVPYPHYNNLPHPAKEISARGFANELDKNFLFYSLLKAADVPCAFALVRGRLQGRLDESVPSIRTFNRSAVYLTKEKMFANTGSDTIEFGALSGELYEAPALLAAADTTALAMTQSPADGVEADHTQFEAALDADGNLDLTLTHAASGDTAEWMRALKNMDRDALRNYLQQIATNLHPAAVLKEYKTTDFADLDVAPSVTMTCAIPGYAFKAGNDLMLFNIPGVDYGAGDVGRPERRFDLFFDHAVQATNKGVIRLPRDYKVYCLPDGVANDGPVASFAATLKEAGNDEVRFEDQFAIKCGEASRDLYPQYKQCKEARAGVSRQQVVLMRR